MSEDLWHVLKDKYRGIYQEHPEWPRTLEEAVAKLIASMSEKDKDRVRSKRMDELIRFHHFWGMDIRNNFGLWNHNYELLESCGSLDGDRASGVIIRAVWRALNWKKPRDKEVTDYARTLFDVVGATYLSDTDTLLVLGLESTPERNLDEFGREGGGFQMYGFEKYAQPRLDALLKFIRDKGYTAELLGHCGYPLQGKINLKTEALRAGRGVRGKSTVVLHPRYGPRLRFMGIVTDAPLEPLGIHPVDTENLACNNCSRCIDACPVGILEPYRMLDPSLCLSDSDRMAEVDGRLVPCDRCLKVCPVGKKE